MQGDRPQDVETLLARLAHELNNPLSVVVGQAMLLEETAGDARTAERAAVIRAAAERCAETVAAFLRIVRADGKPGAVGPVAPPRRLRVLAVEDDPVIGRLLAEILRADGHDVDLAKNGRAALACIRRAGYDVVMSDMRMPELDGKGFYEALGRLRPEMQSRVVFVTGDTVDAASRAFLEATGAPWVAKPFRPMEVRAAVAAAAAVQRPSGSSR